mgnify:CR=1 FL=1|jgi:hypothetical protein
MLHAGKTTGHAPALSASPVSCAIHVRPDDDLLAGLNIHRPSGADEGLFFHVRMEEDPAVEELPLR